MIATLALLFTFATAWATPLYSVRAASECDTCHVEPVGWKNPELAKRQCSLDCSSCHVSPTGGGMREAAGLYFGREALPMFGQRPSQAAKVQEPDPGAPTEGRYSLFKGFSGWWPGSVDSTQVEDRYGKIKPRPVFRAGGDDRIMAYFPLGADGALFPMQIDTYLYGAPTKHFSMLANIGLKGSRGKRDLTDTAHFDASDLVAIRDLYLRYDGLPYNSYVRAGRFWPSFGWRVPDHTSFVRRDLGFDQDRQVWGVEAGINPNYPYANVAVYGQGYFAWPGDPIDPGWGTSITAGYRELGWQAGGSVHTLDRPTGPDDILVGANWGVNLAPVAYLGEFDVRHRITALGGQDALVAYHEIDAWITRGVGAKLKYDWQDPDVTMLDDHKHRVTLGADLHPYTSVELEAQVRGNFSGGGVAFVGAAHDSTEILVMTHAWW